jgi:hypothetical protein
MTVTVKQLNATTVEVTVVARSTTTHVVSVTADYAAQLTGGKVAVDELVKQSFNFLLERESNTSILRSFELPVIGRYFPEYERMIVGMLK